MLKRSLPEHWWRTDTIVAAAIAALGCIMTLLTSAAGQPLYADPVWQQCLGTVASTIPLVWRRRFPLAAGIAQTVAYNAAAWITGIDLYTAQVTLFLGFYSIGAWSTRRGLALTTRILILMVTAISITLSMLFRLDAEAHVEAVLVSEFLAYAAITGIVNIAYFTAAWIFGDRAFEQTLEKDELRRTNQSVTSLQAKLVDAAIYDERLRIARELHDVVAHHVTAMSVQSAAARRNLTRNPETAASSLRQIELSGRSAVQELRSLVLTLRDRDESPASPATLDDLGTLVAAAAQRGQQVAFEQIGDCPPITATAQFVVYRVVQEGLTNAAKHAGPLASVIVRLRGLPNGIEVEISDDGRGHSTRVPGTGVGLQGMRERIGAVGGTLEAGVKPQGGFRVRAFIPKGGEQ